MQHVSKDELGTDMSFKRFSKYVLPLLSILGILLTVELTAIYYFANFVPNAAPSFCVLSETVDCDAVARTAYSHFFGIPLSVYGFFFYVAVLVLNLCANGVKLPLLNRLKNPNSYIFSLATVSVISSIALAWISSVQIHKICLLCYVTYLVNILILVASKGDLGILEHFKRTYKDAVGLLFNRLGFITVLVGAIVAGTSLYFINDSKVFLPKKQDPLLALSQQLMVPKGTNPTGNILGDQNAKIIIREYTDFKCPYCSMSSAMLERLVTELDGVMVVHYDFPLDNTCNKVLKRQIHEGSCELSLYTRAAKNQGKYWDMISAIFNNQETISEAKVLELAKAEGLDVEKLKADASDPALKQELINDVNDAVKLGITATPTLYIGMKKYEGIMPYPELKKLVIEAGAREKK